MDGKREAGPPAKRARTQGSGENDEFSKLYKAMDDYEPTIPDDIVSYYLERSGFATDDVRIKRIVALATQKFVYEVVHEAMRKNKMRGGRDSREKNVLKMEDLASSLAEHGINIVKTDFEADSREALSEITKKKSS